MKHILLLDYFEIGLLKILQFLKIIAPESHLHVGWSIYKNMLQGLHKKHICYRGDRVQIVQKAYAAICHLYTEK